MRKKACSQNIAHGQLAEELVQALEEPLEPGSEKNVRLR
jgi:hypothetical protein